MSGVARIDVEGHWYHIISRGQRRDALFLDDTDRRMYLRLLAEGIDRNLASLGGFCLMTNHVHLLVYRRENSLGTMFRQIHIQYAKYFNRRHKKVGYVFQGRFKSYLVLNDVYLATLLKYIHENPVRAGMVKRVNAYSWSSDSYYRGTAAPKRLGELNLVRVPGFEGSSGTKTYVDLMVGTSSTVDRLPVSGQQVGTEDEMRMVNRRKVGRTRWFRKDHRGWKPIRQRIEQMLKKVDVPLSRLAGPSQKRDISRIRRGLMSGLYQEGYPPSEIARFFKRSPSTVIHACERES